jgi:hypothetical protein
MEKAFGLENIAYGILDRRASVLRSGIINPSWDVLKLTAFMSQQLKHAKTCITYFKSGIQREPKNHTSQAFYICLESHLRLLFYVHAEKAVRRMLCQM